LLSSILTEKQSKSRARCERAVKQHSLGQFSCRTSVAVTADSVRGQGGQLLASDKGVDRLEQALKRAIGSLVRVAQSLLEPYAMF
jgi:hypothetical protein